MWRGISGHPNLRFVHLDPPGLIRPWKKCLVHIPWVSGNRHQALFMTAPSMTTPALTYFHSATSSLRASATIVAFLRRPPFCFTRSLNHKESADCD